MIFSNLGGATGFLEHNGKRILFDPWLDEGIFHGAWHHYPPVSLKDGVKGLGAFDYVYISHIHEDHCSLKTLRQLNDDAELIIMDRTPNFVLQFVQKNELKFKKIHLVPPWKPTQINKDFEVSLVTADPSHELNFVIDSGLIIKWGGMVIYNSNDCIPYQGSLEFIKKTYGHVDLALIPYATGSSYPSCFKNLSHQEKLAEKARLFEVGISKFVTTAAEIKPRFVMPFADQYVIVGNKFELNSYMPHPASPGVIRDHFTDTSDTKLVLLNSGEAFNLETGKYVSDKPFVRHSEDQKSQYAYEHRHSLYDYEKIDMSKSVNLNTLINVAAKGFFDRLKKLAVNSETYFIIEVTDWKKKYVIDLSKHTLTEVNFDATDNQPFLKVSVTASLLVFLLIGHISWNIADAALFIEYERRPNHYDPKIHSLWNYLRI